MSSLCGTKLSGTKSLHEALDSRNQLKLKDEIFGEEIKRLVRMLKEIACYNLR